MNQVQTYWFTPKKRHETSCVLFSASILNVPYCLEMFIYSVYLQNYIDSDWLTGDVEIVLMSSVLGISNLLSL